MVHKSKKTQRPGPFDAPMPRASASAPTHVEEIPVGTGSEGPPELDLVAVGSLLPTDHVVIRVKAGLKFVMSGDNMSVAVVGGPEMVDLLEELLRDPHHVSILRALVMEEFRQQTGPADSRLLTMESLLGEKALRMLQGQVARLQELDEDADGGDNEESESEDDTLLIETEAELLDV